MKKKLHLLAGILSASFSTVLAHDMAPTPVPVPSFSSSYALALRPDEPGVRPENPADRLNGTGIFNSVDQLGSTTTSAGVKTTYAPVATGPVFSIFTEYNYINANDSRLLGSDTQTHSFTLGGSALLNGDLFLGLNYSYSNGFSAANPLVGVSNVSDANFISLVVAKSFMQFLSVGVSGGYGHTDFTAHGPVGYVSSYMDTLSVSPFIALSYRKGRLTTSFTAMYQYENDHQSAPGVTVNDDTHKYSLALRAIYAASERVQLQVLAKYNQVISGLNATPGLPESRHWATFGARVSFAISKPLDVYLGYTYDAFNVVLKTNMITTGLRYSF